MVAPVGGRRGEVFLVDLDPTRGSEIRKTRPCVVVSPDELNVHLRTLIVAPLTTGGQPYPFRVPCRFHGKAGYIVVDQIRTVDHERLLRRLGRLAPVTLGKTLSVLQQMFAP
ncbi:MAG TPA: growth inhibitor PemK [Elusimicrobia bacterium]|nr:MAG: growth inhibitor PemK [Candidatus Rokubacteria bacterium GWA2_70_23]OGK87361.1 MAG: growth inhibitor PemK [Candidatus Rokubacteria bacterium GWC2_70_24]HAM57095.1 growth inhibitor PemK [Candidatus Rokubacteria bacterium]HBL16224.1 growth inhibitor PemK [Elusimicrobiota bacterium]